MKRSEEEKAQMKWGDEEGQNTPTWKEDWGDERQVRKRRLDYFDFEAVGKPTETHYESRMVSEGRAGRRMSAIVGRDGHVRVPMLKLQFLGLTICKTDAAVCVSLFSFCKAKFIHSLCTPPLYGNPAADVAALAV